MKEQELLLQRLPYFKARTSECLISHFCPLSWENFLCSEQVYIHYAVEQCKAEYADIVEFWLHSLFNFLEDCFDDNRFEKMAAQSEWRILEVEEITNTTSQLLRQVGSESSFELGGSVKKSFCMLSRVDVTAFLVETEEGYTSFFWRSAFVEQ